jgi:agmatinase
MKSVIIPCPHEATTSYGQGTKNGPRAILHAMRQVENFDEETGRPMVAPGALQVLKSTACSSLRRKVAGVLKDNLFPIILGGEHSLTPEAVKALAAKYQDISVLQLDAHADLRDAYRGSRASHACAIRRVLEICPAVQAGVRNIAAEEWTWARRSGQINKIHFAFRPLTASKIIRQLSRKVYITIDVDVFDPSVIPATGTPEPGGLSWYAVLDLLKTVCAKKQVVGFDVVELAPRKGEIVSDFIVAKLIYKLIGFLSSYPF